jgi:pyridoxal phosphate enzyme (YggS family)
MTLPLRDFLSRRLDAVEARIRSACQKAGRQRSEITLVAVTKSVSASIAAHLPELGIVNLGESRPQELWRKAAQLPQTVRWHLIGHLQRNKIDKTLPLVRLIHSVDSLRLLEALEHEAATQERNVSVLLEVNASRELNKHGFAPAELPGMIHHIAGLHRVRVEGLMTMAVFEDDPEQCRATFAAVRELRDRLRKESTLGPSLSMGMTNDFEVAIEEGATMIRIGSALFEGISEEKA